MIQAPNPKPLAYSYIRFSDRSQARGDSLRRQLDRAAAYAEKHGLRLDESTTLQDLGVSAFHGDHKSSGALGGFLAAVRKGKIEPGSYLLVESMDRLSREKVLSALGTFVELLTAGIVIVTLMDEVVHSSKTYEENWTGLVFSLSKMAQANEESSKKSDRLSAAWAAKRSRLASGEIATSRCPGWLRVEGDHFVEIEERVAVVRRIFNDFVNGLGRGTIAKNLNQEGIKPFGHGVSWHGGSVQKVTENAAVIGHYQPHTSSRASLDVDLSKKKSNGRTPIGDLIDNYYPAIIDADLYLRARREADSKSVRPGNLGGRKGTVFSNLFTGVGICMVCKKPMVYQTRKRSQPILRCSGNRNGLCENEWRFPYMEIEKQVMDWISEIEIVDGRSEEMKKLASESSRLEIEREQILASARVLVDAFAAAPSSIATQKVLDLETAAGLLDAQITEIKDQIGTLSVTPSIDERKAVVSNWRKAAATLQGEELYASRARIAQAFRSIVKRMMFQRSGGIHVVLKETTKHYAFNITDVSRPSSYSVRVIDMKQPAFVIEEMLRVQEAFAALERREEDLARRANPS